MLPKCMNDLLKCGIPNKNIKVFDLHTGMEIAELQKYDVLYLDGVKYHKNIAGIDKR